MYVFQDKRVSLEIALLMVLTISEMLQVIGISINFILSMSFTVKLNLKEIREILVGCA